MMNNDCREGREKGVVVVNTGGREAGGKGVRWGGGEIHWEEAEKGRCVKEGARCRWWWQAGVQAVCVRGRGVAREGGAGRQQQACVGGRQVQVGRQAQAKAVKAVKSFLSHYAYRKDTHTA